MVREGVGSRFRGNKRGAGGPEGDGCADYHYGACEPHPPDEGVDEDAEADAGVAFAVFAGDDVEVFYGG